MVQNRAEHRASRRPMQGANFASSDDICSRSGQSALPPICHRQDGSPARRRIAGRHRESPPHLQLQRISRFGRLTIPALLRASGDLRYGPPPPLPISKQGVNIPAHLCRYWTYFVSCGSCRSKGVHVLERAMSIPGQALHMASISDRWLEIGATRPLNSVRLFRNLFE